MIRNLQCKSLYFVVALDSERMKVIPVDSFEEHSKIYHERRNAGFETEYEVKHCIIIIITIIVGDVHYNPLSHADLECRASSSSWSFSVALQQTQKQICQHIPM